MSKKRVKKGYWSVKEHCIEEAQQYSGRTAFQDGSPGAWRSAVQHGWIEEACAHMPKDKRYEGQRTLAECEAEARKYLGKWEWRKGHSKSYQKAHREGWLNSIAQRLYADGTWEKPFQWTKATVIAEGRKYKSREDFFKGCCGAYLHAERRGFLEEACAHMKVKGNRLQRLIYAFEFADGYAYVGLTFSSEVRMNEHLSHDCPVSRHIKNCCDKYVFKELTPLMPVKEARRAERKMIRQYARDGWRMLNTRKGGEVGGGNTRTKEQCHKVALKYSTPGEFHKDDACIYGYARVHGWLDEICAHMTKWKPCTREECESAAKDYTTRTAFQKGNRRCYDYATRNGILNEVCAHMEVKQRHRTKDECAAIALKYESRKAFETGNPAVYDYSLRHGWHDEICAHMKTKRKLNKEMVIDVARQYDNKSDFFNYAKGEYHYAKRHGFFEEAVQHMKKREYVSRKHDMKKMEKMVAECPNPFEFRSRHFKEYRAILSKGWFEDLFHRPVPTSAEWHKWNKEGG